MNNHKRLYMLSINLKVKTSSSETFKKINSMLDIQFLDVINMVSRGVLQHHDVCGTMVSRGVFKHNAE